MTKAAVVVKRDHQPARAATPLHEQAGGSQRATFLVWCFPSEKNMFPANRWGGNAQQQVEAAMGGPKSSYVMIIWQGFLDANNPIKNKLAKTLGSWTDWKWNKKNEEGLKQSSEIKNYHWVCPLWESVNLMGSSW